MWLSKEYAQKLFANMPAALKQIERIKGDNVYFDLYSLDSYKSSKQNRLFHSLLSCFWESGCASFSNYDDLRLYYKRVAGLVKKRGDLLTEASWADATKEQAKTAIDMCLRDMDFAGVAGSVQAEKYNTIIANINQYQQEFLK